MIRDLFYFLVYQCVYTNKRLCWVKVKGTWNRNWWLDPDDDDRWCVICECYTYWCIAVYYLLLLAITLVVVVSKTKLLLVLANKVQTDKDRRGSNSSSIVF